MARVTVEDCIVKVPNKFELVMVASQRAREIAGGAPLTIARDNDKNPVIALREIAEESVSIENLRDAMVRGHMRVLPVEETEDEIIELMDGEQGWIRPVDNMIEDTDAEENQAREFVGDVEDESEGQEDEPEEFDDLEVETDLVIEDE